MGDPGPQGPPGPKGQVKVLNAPSAIEDSYGRRRRQAPDPNQGICQKSHFSFPPHFSFITPLPLLVITLNEVNKALFERIDDLWQEAQRMVKSSGNSQEYPALSCKDIKLNNKFARNYT